MNVSLGGGVDLEGGRKMLLEGGAPLPLLFFVVPGTEGGAKGDPSPIPPVFSKGVDASPPSRPFLFSVRREPKGLPSSERYGRGPKGPPSCLLVHGREPTISPLLPLFHIEGREASLLLPFVFARGRELGLPGLGWVGLRRSRPV